MKDSTLRNGGKMMREERLPQEHPSDAIKEKSVSEMNERTSRIVKRSILVFPFFSKKTKSLVAKIRRMYDPLWDKVAAHVTLVFPFESELGSKEMISILTDVLKGVSPFKVCLTGFERFDSGHIFLSITDENGILLSLIRKFYDHPLLSTYKPPFFDILKPHITVAFFPDLAMMNAVFEKIKDRRIMEEIRIDAVDVEIIGEHDESVIEHTYPL